MEDIMEFIRKTYPSQSGIIYCLSRNDCETVAETLTVRNFKYVPFNKFVKKNGFSAAFYHANIPPEERVSIQKQWLNDEVLIIVATIAFGLGSTFQMHLIIRNQ